MRGLCNYLLLLLLLLHYYITTTTTTTREIIEKPLLASCFTICDYGEGDYRLIHYN